MKRLVQRTEANRAFAVLVAMVLMLTMIPTAVFAGSGDIVRASGAVKPSADTITVYADFEGYNLGQGFYIKPAALTLPAGATGETATRMLLEQNGRQPDTGYIASKSGSFYLSSVKDFDTGAINPPSYITETLGSNSDTWLGEMDYTGSSGWMITVNHVLIQTGAGAHILQNGDVIRWQFTVQGLGADLGVEDVSGYGDEPLYTHVDKTALIRAFFLPGTDAAAKQTALDVIIDPLATESAVASALKTLEDAAPDTTPDPGVVTDPDPGTVTDPDPGAVTDPDQAPDPGVDYTKALNDVTAYITKNVEPEFGSIGGEWAVLALARSGAAVPSGYHDAYIRRVNETIPGLTDKDGKLHTAKSTENSRLIIALTSLGKDATDFAGINLTAPLKSDFKWVVNQGINGAIFALIALDTKPYLAGDTATRNKLISFILEREIKGGGWALGEKPKAADADVTAMTLQSLAPYRSDTKVSAAVDRGIGKLAAMQKTNGGFGSDMAGNNESNAESIAQVIIALSSLGIDVQTDSRFQKKSGNPLTVLLTYQDKSSGAVKHLLKGAADGMATEQAACALAAYDRLKKSKTTFYDMKDVASWTAVAPPAKNNKSALAAAAQKAAELDPSRSTPASWKAVSDALSDAIAVLAKDNPTKKEINDAQKALEAAIAALQPASTVRPISNLRSSGPAPVIRSLLEAALEQTDELVEADYTAASWIKVKNALRTARDVTDDTNAKQKDVDNARSALLSAHGALVVIPDADEAALSPVSLSPFQPAEEPESGAATAVANVLTTRTLIGFLVLIAAAFILGLFIQRVRAAEKTQDEEAA